MAGTIEDVLEKFRKRQAAKGLGGLRRGKSRMAIPPIPSHLQLQIVSADRLLVNEQVDEVRDSRHPRAISACCPAIRRCSPRCRWASCGIARDRKVKHYLSIAFGFVEVQPDRVTILAQIAEPAAGNRRGPSRSRPEAGGRAALEADERTSISSGHGSPCSRRSSGCRSRVALESARNCELQDCSSCSAILQFRHVPEPHEPLSIPRADLEPRGARPEGALSRLRARLLLVLRQPAAAAADLLVHFHESHSERNDRRPALRESSCSAASCRGPGSRPR